MKQRYITIIDYGMGNLWSVSSAIRYLGYDCFVTSDPDLIKEAEILLLPGVGSFRKAMMELNERNLSNAIVNAVEKNGKKILGICLGMQLLGEGGSEDGETPGLGLIKCRVDKFKTSNLDFIKIPHIGFNSVFCQTNSRLFKGLPPKSDFYFVHSYRMLPSRLDGKIAICRYGVDFLAAYEANNIFATQFHPEKSQSNGLKLLKNFIEC